MTNTTSTRRSFLSCCAAAGLPASRENELRLWYRQPAPDWNEALPIGNGRLGAMIFGGIAEERLQLNEDTLYSDEPGRQDTPIDITQTFEEVLGLMRRRKYAEAEAIMNRHWIGRVWPCYQPLGDLVLVFDQAGSASEYVRELDIAEAVARVKYRQGSVEHSREVFASHPDQVIALRIAADKPGSLGFRCRLESVHPAAQSEADRTGLLVMRGQVPGLAVRRTLEWIEQRGDQWKYPELWDRDGKRRPNAKPVLYGAEIEGRGMRFEARVRVQPHDGVCTADGGQLVVRRASEVVLLVSAASSFNGFKRSPSREGVSPAIRARRDSEAAARRTYSQIRAEHIADYRKLFDRVSIRLGAPSDQSALPTDERIQSFANGRDPALAALYFQFGRYLMISGSRPGTQPLNLQGIWNKEVIPPWASAYTTNINAEMNYWPAEVANLSECHQPLFHLIGELAENGRLVAKQMYHRRGWVAHHNTTIWRCAQPVDNAAQPAFWPMAAGWFCQHLWEHYLFTGDRKFLSGFAYPLMKGAAEFLADWLVDDGKGHLLTPAGGSPEIGFRYVDDGGKPRSAGVTMGPTMDMAIIRELFTNTIEAARLLDRDPALRRELEDKLARLVPYRVGSRGQLQEWAEDLIEADPKHRHVSHLYPLHPGNQITRRGDTRLFEAARITLELRGDEGTGWSRAWKINFWARMEDGNRAYQLVRNLFQPAKSGEGRYNRGGVMPNLFCSHPPFQIDGNFGGAAGIAEMLLQSHAGEIHFLPALPDAWPEGSARGLCARGGFELSFAWREIRLTEATILSKLGNPCRLRLGEKVRQFATTRGKTYRVNRELEVGPA